MNRGYTMAMGISMVMDRDDGTVTAEEVVAKFVALFPHEPVPTEVSNRDAGAISFEVGSSGVVMMKMPAPIPWSQLEGPCATSLFWEGASAQVKAHKFHWIITVNQDSEPIELSQTLTRVTAAVLAASDASIGVYWGNATSVLPKDLFIKFATDIMSEQAPIPIWVDFRVHRLSATASGGFTKGLEALGHMEIEIDHSPEEPDRLYSRLMDLATYLVANGPVVKNGDTVGSEAGEQIKVVYANSKVGHKGNVMRLEYDGFTPKKPWWRFW